jgi:hypothetical protein
MTAEVCIAMAEWRIWLAVRIAFRAIECERFEQALTDQRTKTLTGNFLQDPAQDERVRARIQEAFAGGKRRPRQRGAPYLPPGFDSTMTLFGRLGMPLVITVSVAAPVGKLVSVTEVKVVSLHPATGSGIRKRTC